MTTPGILNTYTVTTQVALLGQIAAGSMIYNSDTVNAIYVGPSSATSATNGLRIGPLGSVTWTLDAPCYALSSAGNVQVIVTSNATDLSSPLDIALALQAQPNINELGSWTIPNGTFIVPFNISKWSNLIISIVPDTPWIPRYAIATAPPAYVTIQQYININGSLNPTTAPTYLSIDHIGNIPPTYIAVSGDTLSILNTLGNSTLTIQSYNTNTQVSAPTMYPTAVAGALSSFSGGTISIPGGSTIYYPTTYALWSGWLYGTTSTPSYPTPPYPISKCLISAHWQGEVFASVLAGHTINLYALYANHNALLLTSYTTPNSGTPFDINTSATIVMPTVGYLCYWQDMNSYSSLGWQQNLSISLTITQQ